MPSQHFQLPYGRNRRFGCDLEADRVLVAVRPPEGLPDVPGAVERAIANPLDFPPLWQTLVDGDRIIIVLDRLTPQADQLLLGVWKSLANSGVEAENVHIIQPADLRSGRPVDPRSALPAEIRQSLSWRVHDPLDDAGCGYLATTAGGERIYLSRELIDADVVICIGPIAFDESLGYRGTLSAVYPGLSNAESLRKSVGAAHAELEPDSPRPLRELADEIGWLLGVQFVVQVIPAENGGVAEVLAGLAEPVLTRGKGRLRKHWQLDLDERAELVIASVDADAGGHGWPQAAAALDTARHIVARDGRILLLTELAEAPTPGIELIRDARTPHEALRPVREKADADCIEALQLARALDRANVYLMSQLDDDLVEELFMVPIASPKEALRVIEGAERCAVIGSAQHVFVRHAGAQT